jgi:Peptide methionine sulfoxide reductase
MTETKKAILAGGCFWGVQGLIRKLDGVTGTLGWLYRRRHAECDVPKPRLARGGDRDPV